MPQEKKTHLCLCVFGPYSYHEFRVTYQSPGIPGGPDAREPPKFGRQLSEDLRSGGSGGNRKEYGPGRTKSPTMAPRLRLKRLPMTLGRGMATQVMNIEALDT